MLGSLIVLCGGCGLWQSNLLADPGRYADELGPACDYVPQEAVDALLDGVDPWDEVDSDSSFYEESTCIGRSDPDDDGRSFDLEVTFQRYLPRDGWGGPSNAKEAFQNDWTCGTGSRAHRPVTGIGDEAESVEDGTDNYVCFRLDNLIVITKISAAGTGDPPAVDSIGELATAIAGKLEAAG